MGGCRNSEIGAMTICFVILTAGGFFAGFLPKPFAGIAAGASCLLLAAVFFFFTKRRYRQLAELNEQIDRILHGDAVLHPEENREGELSILQNQIYKMTVRLKEQNETLERERQYLADSLADISHQLRTPLTSLQLLRERMGREEITRQERLACLREQTRLMNRIDWLITALLKISRLEAGVVTLNCEQVNLASMFEKAAESLAIPLELSGVNLVTELSGELSFTGDFAWTAEAVTNILKNCMEHTPAGGRITVTGSENAIATDLIIEDEGPGIPAEDLPHLFERFYRGKYASDGSVGIGLALTRMILSRENGVIRAENRDGKGARFLLRFYKGIV